MNSIGIFTQYHMQPPHPRIQMEYEILKNQGFNIEIIHSEKKKFRGFLYYLSFTMFNWQLIWKYKSVIQNYDILIIYDFALLPLAIYAKKSGKKVIYETIDHNIKFTFFELKKRFLPIKFFKFLIVPFFENLEKRLIRNNVNHVIVNSKSLYDSFQNIGVPVTINYYASPFEEIQLNHPENYYPALLYLGRISLEKGLKEMLSFAREVKNPLILIGPVDNKKVKELLDSTDHVVHYDKMNISELIIKIISISKEYNLWGLSIVTDKNESTAIQELNKEIDYLALGTPIIGNKRPLTAEKIMSGCGISYNNPDDIIKIKDSNQYQLLSKRSKDLYWQKYRKELFINKLLNIIHSFL